MSVRRQQLASTIRRALQEILARGLQDPRVSGLITVTGVELDNALKTAVVSVSILPEDRQDLVMHGLHHAATHIRRRAGDLVDVRQMPALVFKLDTSLKKQAKVYEAISRAAAERGGAAPDATPQDPSGPGEPAPESSPPPPETAP